MTSLAIILLLMIVAACVNDKDDNCQCGHKH